MSMTVTNLESIRSEESFNLFWKRTQQQWQQLGAAEPNLPKQRKVPRRYEVGSSFSEVETSVEAFYRKTYYEVIDYVVQAIRSRFDQNGYKILCRLEELLCDAKANLEDFDDILSLYGNDLDKDRLATQLSVLHHNIPKEIENEKGGIKLKIIINFLQSLNPTECQFYSLVMHLAKLIHIMPATSAVSERSLSALR